MRRRIYFDAMRRGEDTPPYAFLGKAVLKRAGGVEPRPYGQLGGWYGGTAGRCRHRPLRRVTRGAAKRAVGDAGPYGCVARSADGRADVGIGPYGGLQGVRQNGSSGKSAKRCRWQKKRGGFEEVPRLVDTTVAGNRLARRWATAVPYEISSFGIFPDENFLRQGDSVISRLFSSGLPSTMGETKEGIA